MSYVIGSFNIRDFNLSNKSADGEDIKRDFRLIADIIKKEKFDVVAVQEVNAEIAIKFLTDILNRNKDIFCEWNYDFSGKAATTIGDPEGYGFIWNTKRLRLLDIPNKNNPKYYNAAGGKSVLRPPYYGSFTVRGLALGGNFELRIVNVHIQDFKREPEKIGEFNILVRQVLPRICEHCELYADNEIMPSYTFMMGDYNLVLNKSERSTYRIETITNTDYTRRMHSFVTIQDKPTSLRLPREQQTIEDCYANNFDHFTYDADLDRKLVLTPQRVEALTQYFPEIPKPSEKLSEYRKKISDHVPIKLVLDLK